MSVAPGATRLLCCLCGVLAMTCSRDTKDKSKPQPSEAAQIDKGSLQIRHGSVGLGNERTKATYVLFDVSNDGQAPLHVQCAGELFSETTKLAALRAEMLVIPPKSTRTFALIPSTLTHYPKTTGATIWVSKTEAVQAPPPIDVSDPVLHEFAGRSLVKFWVHNKADRRALANIHATFRDKNDTIMDRPAVHVELKAGQKRVVQIPGPAGAVKASPFLGEHRYP